MPARVYAGGHESAHIRETCAGERGVGAGRALAERLLAGKVYEGETPAQFFSLCYRLRSSILHSGKVPVEITDFISVCTTAHAFVCDLLIASFGERQLGDIAPG